MKPLILNGKSLAKSIESDLSARVEKLKTVQGKVPCLATILVGDDPASFTYVQMKRKACERIGILSQFAHLPSDISTSDLTNQISVYNEDPQVDGILLQHPVPTHIDERACFNEISPEKDVDGVTSFGYGQMSMGEQAYGSATPTGIMHLLRHYQIPLKGKRAVVLGRSAILGKPMAMMLLNANATVTICHSHTQGIEEICRQADILVAAVGRAAFVKGDWVKKGAVVIDAGYHPGRIGDVDLEQVAERSSAYTPVPGGVGPMTIISLLAQTVESAEKCG